MFDSVSGVNPLIVVPAIIRTLPQQLLVIALLAMVWLLRKGVSGLLAALPWGWRLVTWLPVEFYSLYSVAVTARLLGLLYHYNADKLGWLD